MRKTILSLIILLSFCTVASAQKSTKQERNLITSGNQLYKQQKYAEAAADYQAALTANPSSAEARYNLGLTQLRLSSAKNIDEKEKDEYKKQASDNLSSVASLGSSKPKLASMANYNLGNNAFNTEDLTKAIEYYKQALRLNPNDGDARRNLRIAQKKQQQNQNNKDQNKDQNKDNNKDQNKDNKQDQNQQNKNQDQDKQQNQDRSQLNQQTANQILQAVENKENQTRARVNAYGDKSTSQNRSGRKNW
jgi:tetratricopeptide (TPR) repeat protein